MTKRKTDNGAGKADPASPAPRRFSFADPRTAGVRTADRTVALTVDPAPADRDLQQRSSTRPASGRATVSGKATGSGRGTVTGRATVSVRAAVPAGSAAGPQAAQQELAAHSGRARADLGAAPSVL
ncbi:MAG TPA: hypothetical protein VFO77_10545, partial [Actinoplanes sp.]|nr:hypothetical protein [Actinoplanes sp.]